MPDHTQLPTRRPSNHDLQAMDFADALDAYTPSLADALPSHIPLNRFKRVVVTAVNMNPDLRRADRRSLFNACVKCAHDGLYPDGREAALVVFSTKVKYQDEKGFDRERWIDAVQYLPMIIGIRKRMRNTGEVLSATAEVVYRNDKFRFVKGEDPRIEHEPCTLDQDRGDPVGAYAIIKLKNGETLREVMGFHEIERVRAFSRNAKTKSGKGPWETSWGEMARKTVLRRCSKAAPTGSDLAQLLARDDEEPEYPQADNFPAPPARPRRDDFIDLGEEGSEEETGYNDDGPSPGEEGMHSDGVYTLVDPDGQFQDFETATDAANAFGGMLGDLVPRGERMLKAAWEDNSPLLVKLEAEDATAFRFVIDAYDAALRLVPSRSAPRTQTREQAKPSPAPATSEPKQTTQPAPAQAAPPSPERSYKIGPVPTKADGKPDYRAWAWGLFIVQVRKEADPVELAWLISENDEDIQAYKRSAPQIDRNRFQMELDKISAALQAQSQGT